MILSGWGTPTMDGAFLDGTQPAGRALRGGIHPSRGDPGSLGSGRPHHERLRRQRRPRLRVHPGGDPAVLPQARLALRLLGAA